MDSETARKLYFKYRDAVAYVAVESPAGDQQIGSAFYLGEEIWVTARHVVENQIILKVATRNRELELVDGPLLHPDESVDVALLRLHSRVPDSEVPVSS